MSAFAAEVSLQTVEGTLLGVDLLNRIVMVRGDEAAWTFDVPASCEILLNGERVKLRLLQPRDRVFVTYRTYRGGQSCCRALSVEACTRS